MNLPRTLGMVLIWLASGRGSCVQRTSERQVSDVVVAKRWMMSLAMDKCVIIGISGSNLVVIVMAQHIPRGVNAELSQRVSRTMRKIVDESVTSKTGLYSALSRHALVS
jgi:hypothetical protein